MNAMILGYEMNGLEKQALILKEMKDVGIIPESATFVGILSAQSHVGLVKINWKIRAFPKSGLSHGTTTEPQHVHD